MEPNTIYLLILIGISIVFIAIGAVTAYLRVVSMYLSLKEEQINLKRDIAREKDKALEEAGRQTVQIVEEARLKAQEIIKQAQIFSTDQKSGLSEEIKRLSEVQGRQYQAFLQDIQKQVIMTTQSVSSESKEEMLKEIKVFRDTLQAEVARSQSEARSLILNAYKTIETEVERYKEMRFKELDKGIFEIVKEISKKVIGKEINVEEHEKLVTKTLEEAKQQNVF